MNLQIKPIKPANEPVRITRETCLEHLSIGTIVEIADDKDRRRVEQGAVLKKGYDQLLRPEILVATRVKQKNIISRTYAQTKSGTSLTSLYTLSPGDPRYGTYNQKLKEAGL